MKQNLTLGFKRLGIAAVCIWYVAWLLVLLMAFLEWRHYPEGSNYYPPVMDQEEIMAKAALAVVGPILLLGVVLLLRWIIRGFRIP